MAKLRKPEKYIKHTVRKGRHYYQVSFQYTDVTGIKRTYSKTFSATEYGGTSKALDAAIKHRDEARVRLVSNPGNAGSLTLNQLFELWVATGEQKPSTKRKHKYTFKNYILKEIDGDRTIDTLTGIDVRRTLQGGIKTLNDKSMDKILTLWRLLYNTALAGQYKMADITAGIGKPGSEKEEVHTGEKVFRLEDFWKMYNWWYDDSHYKTDRRKVETKIRAEMFMVMTLTGIRPEECCALDRRNIDWENKTLLINHAITEGDGEWILGPTKTRKPRKLPLSDAAIQHLRILAEMAGQEDYLCLNFQGQFWNMRVLSSLVSKDVKRAEASISMQTCRHGFATILQTVDPITDQPTVMALMGHSTNGRDPGMMSLSYARPPIENAIRAVEKVASVIMSGRPEEPASEG